MPSPSEPEKYSIDDMMERLKSVPAPDPAHDGALVTRPDGSQAIRVRKRKRRTQQPQKEAYKRARRIRIIQVSAVLLLVLLTIGGAGTAIILANSAPFREKLVQHVARSSGASVEIEQFRMNPTTANAARLALNWPEGNVLQSLTLGGLQADVSLASFFGSALSGDEMTCAEGSLVLQVPVPNQAVWNSPVRGNARSLHFNRYAISRAHLLLGDAAVPLLRLRNSDVSFYPIRENGRTQLIFYGGDLDIQGWLKLRLNRAHIEFHGSNMEVVGMRLHPASDETDNQGLLSLCGTVAPFVRERPSRLAVRLESYPIAALAGPELGRFFSGKIDTRSDGASNFLAFTPAMEPKASLSIAFGNSRLASFRINGFPFLFGLAQTLGDDWFECPVFQSEVTGVLNRADGRVSIGDLSFEYKERMALQGEVILERDQTLSGHFRIGVAENLIESARSRRLGAMFGATNEGFRWLTLNISGTALAPKDNFKELYDASARTDQADPKDDIPSFEELTRPK